MKNSGLLKSIEYVEIYVSNALQAAYFYQSAFGFNIHAVSDLSIEEGNKISYLLRQGSILLMISSSTSNDSPILRHIAKHDEDVKDVAFSVLDTKRAFEKAIKAGATPILNPIEIDDGTTKIIKATVAAFGSTVHSFIERRDPTVYQLPCFVSTQPSIVNKEHAGIHTLDHIAVAVETGELEKWKKFYEDVLGLSIFYKEDVYTKDSGMKSIVVSNSTGTIKIVLVEGVAGKEKSKIEKYITHHGGAGVQHVAFASHDIINSVNYLRQQGIKFLKYPSSYYENMAPALKKKLNPIMHSLKDLNILVDLEENGYLMQVFTAPLQNRPTFFIEIIQRENSIGFGSNNIKNLYEALQ